MREQQWFHALLTLEITISVIVVWVDEQADHFYRSNTLQVFYGRTFLWNISHISEGNNCNVILFSKFLKKRSLLKRDTIEDVFLGVFRIFSAQHLRTAASARLPLICYLRLNVYNRGVPFIWNIWTVSFYLKLTKIHLCITKETAGGAFS